MKAFNMRDLLPERVVATDAAAMCAFVKGRRVLVTAAETTLIETPASSASAEELDAQLRVLAPGHTPAAPLLARA